MSWRIILHNDLISNSPPYNIMYILEYLSMNPVIRSFLWRLSRRLYSIARRDTGNNPQKNGEYDLIDKLINQSIDSRITFIDIGANIGDWTDYVRQALIKNNKTGVIHSFEPTTSTFSFLNDRFDSDPLVSINKIALSDKIDVVDFFVAGDLAGTNSILYSSSGARVERVQTQTLDNYIASKKLTHINLVKSDTEGYDLNVLYGAKKALSQGIIDVWQFEYNFRWLLNKSCLKDVFDFISEKPYLLGKLHNGGIEIIKNWNPELDRFFEANYVLVRQGSTIENYCHIMKFNESNILAPA